MKVPALVRRAGWNLGEQMISSLTNSVLSILVANSVSADSFGGFAVAFTVFALAVGGVRAVSTSPLNIRFSDASPGEAKRVAAASAGNALVLGILIGAGCAVAGLSLPGALGESLLALGVVMPALLVQDTYRYVFFARGEPAKAAMTSGLWAVLQIGAVTALLVVGTEAVGTLLLAWGISAAAAALLAVRQSGAWPAPRAAWSWIEEHRDLTGYKLATFVTAQGTTQGAILVIAAVATLATVGSLRGTQVLLGPTSILALATLNFALPELARRRSRMTDRTWMYAALGVSGFVGLAGLVWGSIFLLAPDAFGEFILDASWPGTSAILFAAVVTQVLSGLSIGPVTVIYAIDRAPATLSIQIVLGVLTFVGGVGGVLLGGAIGAQWGFAVANAIVVPCWYIQMRRQLTWVAEHRPAEVDDGPEDTTVLAARPPQHDAFFDNMSTMSTMLMPRVEPRVAQPPRAAGRLPGGPPRAPLPGRPGGPYGPPRGAMRPPGVPPEGAGPGGPNRFGPNRPGWPRPGANRPGPQGGPGWPPPPGVPRPGRPRPRQQPPPGPGFPPPGRTPNGPVPSAAGGPQAAPPAAPWLPPAPPRRGSGPEPRPAADAAPDGRVDSNGNGRPRPHPNPQPGPSQPDPGNRPSADRGAVPGSPVPYRRSGDGPRPQPTPRRPDEPRPQQGATQAAPVEATTALPPAGEATRNSGGRIGHQPAVTSADDDTQVHAARASRAAQDERPAEGAQPSPDRT